MVLRSAGKPSNHRLLSQAVLKMLSVIGFGNVLGAVEILQRRENRHGAHRAVQRSLLQRWQHVAERKRHACAAEPRPTARSGTATRAREFSCREYPPASGSASRDTNAIGPVIEQARSDQSLVGAKRQKRFRKLRIGKHLQRLLDRSGTVPARLGSRNADPIRPGIPVVRAITWIDPSCVPSIWRGMAPELACRVHFSLDATARIWLRSWSRTASSTHAARRSASPC